MVGRAWRLRAGVLGLAAGLVLAACGGNGQPQSAAGGANTGSGQTMLQPGFFNSQEPPGQPVDGGVLDFAIFSEVENLDPADLIGKGCCGGVELTAIYDSLVRYNPETDEYEPHLAKSLSSSNDFQTWTMTLRPNVNFTDGTPLNAAAVKFSIERYIREDGYLAEPLDRMLRQIATPDPQTVVFELENSWPRFPSMLADTPGNIVSPTAVKKWGEDYGKHPVGAGPFMLQRFAPSEEIVVTANPNYWGGRPHLDTIRFVPLTGAEIKLDALNTGELDAAIIKDAPVTVELMQQGYSGYLNIQNWGTGLLINHRQGRPGSDVRVRKAVALALDPKVIDQAAYEGKGLPGKGLFQGFSRWHTNAPLNSYNPGKAKQLASAAKQDGYDGEIGLSYGRTGEDVALAMKALLEAVGFSVTLDVARTTPDLIRKVAVDRNFDLATWGVNIPDASPYPDFWNRYIAENNISGYQSAELERLLGEFVGAANDQAKLDVMAEIQQYWTESVPSVVTGASPEAVVWQDNVHGMIASRDSMVYLHDVWMSK